MKKANEIAATGFAMALLLGIIVAILGNLNVRLIASLIGASETSMDDTVSYLRIILLGAPFMMGQFVINNQLRFQGSAMYAMVGLLCGAIMNIGLDPLLMFGFGLGIKGAAIATVCGQITSFIALIIGSSKGENIRLHVMNVRMNIHNMLEICNGGLPSLIRQSMAAIAIVLLNRVALEYGGDAAIAGMSIVTRILMMVSSVLIGFGQGYQPVCSYNYGAGRYDRVKEGFWFCLKFGTIMMTMAAVICFIPASSIVAWFRNDPEVIAVGTRALRWQASVLPTLAMTTLTNMMLQATGKGIQASITSSARNGIFFIPLIMILPRILGLTGVVMAQAIADICTVCLCIPFLAKALGTMK